MRSSLAALTLSTLALSACGLLHFGAAAPGSLTCDGGPSFGPEILEGGGGAENAADPAAEALRRHLATDHIDIDMLPDAGWIEISRSGDTVIYVAADPAAAGNWVQATVGREGDAWDVNGWGGCTLMPDVGAGMAIGSFRLAVDPLDPAATEIRVLVTERACNSGEDAAGRIEVASVEEDDDSVTVTLAVRPRGGGQSCPSNPETPFVIQLSEPIGERVLLDGSSVPPRDATVCPEIAICP